MADKQPSTRGAALHKKRQLKTRVQTSPGAPPTVPFRWIATMMAALVALALVCAWGTLCLLFWQGSWQLLYHPSAEIVRTPANVGLGFDAIKFGAVENGQPTLDGWWVPAAAQNTGYTALYLHGADGNMGDSVAMVQRLHESGLNVFVFDYRGYGHSKAAHPSEKRWREDADEALRYLAGTRHIAPRQTIVVGRDLGANLALEVAARHGELGGAVMLAPLVAPANAIFRDARTKIVPAELLVSDRWDWRQHAPHVQIPMLWYEWSVAPGVMALPPPPDAFDQLKGARTLAWLNPTRDPQAMFGGVLSEWLTALAQGKNMPPQCLVGADMPC